MKFKQISILSVTVFILGAVKAFAQISSAHCSHMSKDPKCWENRDNTDFPRPYFCSSRNHCLEIESIHQDSRGKFHCTDSKGTSFDCNKLVQDFGINLQGLQVKVTTPYIDGCHIPGGCGPRACTPSYGTASFDEACE